ncbi:MAG TPA: hypothetical protein VNE60_13145 [Gemmatimonadaceae bacterium]|nr:hypothetical protein [Gemmatimonadaceae bacterium]
MAGLLVLRLVERWVTGGCRAPVDVAGARAAVEAMDTGNPARGMLGEVLSAIARGGPEEIGGAFGQLMAYARVLEYAAQWPLALAVYETVIANGGPPTPNDAVVLALIRQAFCLRMQGRFDEALTLCKYARRLAIKAGDLEGELRAELGVAMGMMAQGHLIEADAKLRAILRRAPRDSRVSIRSMVLNGRAAVAGMRGDTVSVIRLEYAALRENPIPSERDRILHNIGEAFRRLGVRAVARDAFLVLSCTAEEQYMRWFGEIQLMLIAAQDGEAAVFEEHRSALDSAALPPQLRLEFLGQLAASHRLLGEPEIAASLLLEAVQLAQRHGFEFGELGTEPGSLDPCENAGAMGLLPPRIARIADAIRALRESTGAGA